MQEMMACSIDHQCKKRNGRGEREEERGERGRKMQEREDRGVIRSSSLVLSKRLARIV